MEKDFWLLKKKQFLNICLVISFLFLPLLVRGVDGSSEPVPDPFDYESELTKGTIILEKGNLVGIILESIRTLLAFLGVVTLVMIIFAGLKWMAAGSNEENVKKAKMMLRNALIGLCICLLAYAITTWVITSLWTIASLHSGILPPPLFFL